MVVQTQNAPTVDQERTDSKQKQKHKLINLEDFSEASALGLLAPIADQVVQKTQVAMKAAEEAYSVAKPTVDPMISFVREQHIKHPEVIKIVVACVGLLYGGCFFHCAVLFATWKLADTQKFTDEMFAAFTGTGGDLLEKAVDTLRKSDPAEMMKLLKSFCMQFCIYSAVLYNNWATAAVLAIYIEEQASFLRPLIITKLKPYVETDEMQRWIPMGVNVGTKAALTLIGMACPQFLAALLLSYEGGLVVATQVAALDIPAVGLDAGKFEEMSELTQKSIGVALACAASIWQWFYGFADEHGLDL